MGEIVGATVMLKPDAQLRQSELKNFLKDKIAAFKQPEHIFFQTEPLPRGATGKIYKRGIREEAISKLKININK